MQLFVTVSREVKGKKYNKGLVVSPKDFSQLIIITIIAFNEIVIKLFNLYFI